MKEHISFRNKTMTRDVPFWFVKVPAAMLREADKLRRRLGMSKGGVGRRMLERFLKDGEAVEGGEE